MELKQNSKEWHEFRRGGLGASESNIIMGKSQFMSPLQLWNQKVYGPTEDDMKGNFITDKGHRLEAKARPLFEMEVDDDFPDTIAVHKEIPWLRASLDGYSVKTNSCWECKFVGQDDFEQVRNGVVLDKYFPQLQHQLLVSGGARNYLYVIADDNEKKEAGEKFPFKTCFIEVLPDKEYMEKELMPELVKFWGMVKSKKEPKISSIDVVNLDDNNDLDILLKTYSFHKNHLDNHKAMLEATQKDIFKIAKHTKNICNGVKITKSKSEDSTGFDHKKWLDDNNVWDIKYEKVIKGRTTKRITFPKV